MKANQLLSAVIGKIMHRLTERSLVISRANRLGSGQGTSDEALISAIAAGDHRAMQVLYARHHVRVYRFVVRLTQDRSLAEDVVGDVFIDVWRQAGSYKIGRQCGQSIILAFRHARPDRDISARDVARLAQSVTERSDPFACDRC